MTSSLLPAEFNTVTLSGQYVNLDGTPVAGYLVFKPSPAILKAAASKDIIVPVSLNVSLDGTGRFSQPLPATDDPDIAPVGWTYEVTEAFGNRRVYSVGLHLDNGTSQNIFDLAPVALANGTYYEQGLPGPAGPPAMVVSGAPGATVGAVGDFAIDPVAGVFYGPKSQVSGWPTGVHLAATDIASHAALTNTHGLKAGSAVVGTTDTQTLSNKTLAAPVVTGGLTTTSINASGDVAAHDITGNIGGFVKVTASSAPSGASDLTRKDYVDGKFGGFLISSVNNGGYAEPSLVNPDSSQGAALRIGNYTGSLRILPYPDGTTYVQTSQSSLSFTGSNGADATSLTFGATATRFTGQVSTDATPPTAVGHLTRKDYVDAQDAKRALTTTTISAGTGLTGGGDLSAARTLAVSFGTTATTVAAGNHTHVSAGVTDAASAATVNVLIKRDAAGRAQVVDPAVAADIATKNYVDLNAVGVSAPTVSTGMRRDSAGRAQVVDPAVAADIATKNYVDLGDNYLTLSSLQAGTTYTLALADAGRLIETNTSTTMVVTVPADATVNFPIGTLVRVFRISGSTTISPAAGVTFRMNGSGIIKQYGEAYLRKRAANDWEVWGDFTTVPVQFLDVTASQNWTAPGPFVIHPNRTFTPATMFGPGMGAKVTVDSRVLVDIASGASGWYLNLFRGFNGGTQSMANGDYKATTGRTVLAASYTDIIPAGQYATYHTELNDPGGTQVITTYNDNTTNRTLYTVEPYSA